MYIRKEGDHSAHSLLTLYSPVPVVSMPPGPTITVSDVHLRYSAQQAPVLAGVNLTISAGTVYCLLGPSGAGKTSLLKVQLMQIRNTFC